MLGLLLAGQYDNSIRGVYIIALKIEVVRFLNSRLYLNCTIYVTYMYIINTM